MADSEEVRYQVRMPRRLKDAFLRAAELQDRSGAQLVRDFVRGYISEHQDQMQYSLDEQMQVQKSQDA